jgi:hypothetical protein
MAEPRQSPRAKDKKSTGTPVLTSGANYSQPSSLELDPESDQEDKAHGFLARSKPARDEEFDEVSLEDEDEALASAVDQANSILPDKKFDEGRNGLTKKYPTEVFENLFFIGGIGDAKNLDRLKELKIDYIINLCKGGSNYFPSEFMYITHELPKNPKSDMLCFLPAIFDSLDQAKSTVPPSRTLIHDELGNSYAPAVMIAYAMKLNDFSLINAYRFIKSEISPNNP